MIPPFLSQLRGRVPRLQRRARILRAIRGFFGDAGFTEVETPLLLATVAPEEHILPVTAGAGVLATSPELQMKQLVAAGLSPIFQIGRSFRAGEHGRRHNVEFAMLEWYRSGHSIHGLVRDLEGLLVYVARSLDLGASVVWQGRRVDLSSPFRVTPVQEAFVRYAGWDPVADFDADRFDLDLVERVEPQLGKGRPEVLAWYPAALGSLARTHPEDPRLSQRMELYVEGMELANGFVELSDAAEQRRRFSLAQEAIRQHGREPTAMPEQFLDVLPCLPDTVGIALGIDRLVMLFCDTDDIRDVLAFGPDDA